MGPLPSTLLLAGAAAGLCWLLVGLYARAMQWARRLEPPNARSMHTAPVPTGAGIALVATIAVLSPWWLEASGGLQPALLACLLVLGALSWLDDRRGLTPAVRLLAQTAAVALCLVAVPAEARVLPALPLLVERGLLGLAWLWFINLFNFMDGIDGLAGGEAVAVALGYLAVTAWAGNADAPWLLALVLAAAAAGYLPWNWHPARVFMGDAGSIPLGLLLGALMLDLALRGHWAAGLILPLYFAADASLTLLARARRGEKPWQAHREHFYQRAVLGGAGPAAVVWRVALANLALLLLALLSLARPLIALAGAAAVVLCLLAELERLARRAPAPQAGSGSASREA